MLNLRANTTDSVQAGSSDGMRALKWSSGRLGGQQRRRADREASVQVLKGRSFPYFPGLILAIWTMFVMILLMQFFRFDKILRDRNGEAGEIEGILWWQRVTFTYMKGLDVRPPLPCIMPWAGML